MPKSDEEGTIVVREKSSIDGKTLIIGGGIVALIIFLLSRGGGGGAYGQDKQALTFKLHKDGLWLGTSKMDVTGAISRIFGGRRNDMVLIVAGDVPQGVVDTVVDAFQNAGIRVYQKQPIASIYRRGIEGNIA